MLKHLSIGIAIGLLVMSGIWGLTLLMASDTAVPAEIANEKNN